MKTFRNIFKNIDPIDKAYLTYDFIYIGFFVCVIIFTSFN